MASITPAYTARQCTEAVLRSCCLLLSKLPARWQVLHDSDLCGSRGRNRIVDVAFEWPKFRPHTNASTKRLSSRVRRHGDMALRTKISGLRSSGDPSGNLGEEEEAGASRAPLMSRGKWNSAGTPEIQMCSEKRRSRELFVLGSFSIARQFRPRGSTRSLAERDRSRGLEPVR